MNKYTYDGRLSGNILVIGQTGCRKTTFVQNLAINSILWELNLIGFQNKNCQKKREKQIQFFLRKYVCRF